MNLCVVLSDVMPKIVGGFVDYKSSNSRTYYGRRLEWGTYYNENQLQGISHMPVLHQYCWLDMGYGYCYQRLVISSNINEPATGYDIKGGYVNFIDGDVTTRWGISSEGRGLIDTVVASGKIPYVTNHDANLHFLLEETDGAYTIDGFSGQRCSTLTLECEDMEFNTWTTIKNTSVAHQLVNFFCYSRWHPNTRCDFYIWT